MEKLINTDFHFDKVRRDSIKIKANYPVDTLGYMNHLYDFFLDDLTIIAEQLYEDFLINLKSNSVKCSFVELEAHFVIELQNILPNYDRIINGYNFGGMLREYRTLEEDKKNFKINADNKIKKLAKSFSYKYRDLLKKERQMNFTTLAAIVGAIGTIITIVSFIISLSGEAQEIRLVHNEGEYGFNLSDVGLLMT
ncbi:TPA: hypothetical protein ACVO5S_001886 [Legionella pneumophila]